MKKNEKNALRREEAKRGTRRDAGTFENVRKKGVAK